MNECYEIEATSRLTALKIAGVTGIRLNVKQQKVLVGLDTSGQLDEELDGFLDQVVARVRSVLDEYVREATWSRQFSKDDWGHFSQDGTILIITWKT